MLLLDDNWEPGLSSLDARLASAFWLAAKRDEELPWLDTCWLLYHLRQKVKAQVLINAGMKVAEVERWMTWESSLAQRAAERPCFEWAWFCENRLDINSNTASQRKRIWEVFVVTLGWTEEQMFLAGKSKLGQAASRVEKDWKRGHVDDVLMELLAGKPNVCLACDAYVPYDEPPERCPECGAEYQELQPGTFSEVRDHIEWRKEAERSGQDEGVVHDYALGGDPGDREREIIDWLRRPGEAKAQPYVMGKLVRYEAPGMMTLEPGEGAETLRDEEAKEAWVELVERIEK